LIEIALLTPQSFPPAAGTRIDNVLENPVRKTYLKMPKITVIVATLHRQSAQAHRAKNALNLKLPIVIC